MATISGTHVWIAKGVLKSVWSSITGADVGTYLDAPNLPDKTVTVSGPSTAPRRSFKTVLG